ncbi:MAG: rod shape-determining protein RodA [Rhodospirillaceae bacterium]|nr:rod shape-determining protein RodA [Rhodospirillaceae bacterium]|tara:strand:+ start:33487 stop:34653 length:1167 start_codon:yes stop_codon:yes gene_type:complete
MVAWGDRFGTESLTIGQKLGGMSWGLVALILLTAGLGFAMLYSAAGGDLRPWAFAQMVRFAMGLMLMVMIALVDIRTLHRFSYAVYGGALLLLVAVEFKGSIGMGAQRWIEISLPGSQFQLQPSEIMKIALMLVLARYFHGLSPEQASKWTSLLLPLVLIALPTALVLRQPDLGTAMMIVAGGVTLMFLAGIALRWFVGAFIVTLGALPVVWNMLHDYQRQRVEVFLDPSLDPLGAGWNITQSKIALGSGGLFGKGFLEGTQSHLNFLPEKQTDFIFTMLAEEIGMVGALLLIALYLLIIAYGFGVALRSSNQFGRLLALGVVVAFFLYVFINIAMVTGLVPVVGVPLPLISYGGTAMLTLMVGFGLLASVHVHRDIPIPRRPSGGTL